MKANPKQGKAVAKRAAIDKLKQALPFVAMHLTKPLFQKRMRMGGEWVMVHLDLSFTLTVFDCATGQVLAQSVSGAPDAISLQFVPPDPAWPGERKNLNPQLREATARRAAKEKIEQAWPVVAMHLKNKVFQKRMRMGGAWVVVRLAWPCILSVLDPETGQVLAQSKPCSPGAICPHFVPPDPVTHSTGVNQ
jgi:hypothetical protein